MTTPASPTLSVLIPNYNHAIFLPQALRAILGADYRPHEVIVLDDGSTDDSLKVLEAVARDNSVMRIVRVDRNQGVVRCINALLAMAAGDYVAFCASDDIVLPQYFSKSMALLSRHPEAGLCSALSLQMNQDGGALGLVPSVLISRSPVYLSPTRVRDVLWSTGSWIQGNTTVYRRSALVGAGGFDPELRSFCDSFVAMAIASRHGACFVPTPLGVWRRMPTGYASSINADGTATEAIIRMATERMRSRQFSDVFPERFVVRWEREMLLSRFVDELLRVRTAGVAFADRAAGGPAHEGVNARVGAGIMRSAATAHWQLARAGLFLRYPAVTVLRRRLLRMRGGLDFRSSVTLAKRAVEGGTDDVTPGREIPTS